jgi:hypothetical protein
VHLVTAAQCESKGGPTPTPETLIRAAQVARWLVAGNGTAEVYGLAAVTWGVAHRQTDRLLNLARAEIRAAWELERPELIALLLSRADLAFRMAVEDRNVAAAVGAISQAAKLARL